MAFLWIPAVATATWYVLSLLFLLIGNGGLSFRRDILTLAVGGVLVGLPVATIVTLVLALPLYFVVRLTVGVSRASTVVGGAMVGLLAVVLPAMLDRRFPALLVLLAILIGAASGAIWWRMTERDCI